MIEQIRALGAVSEEQISDGAPRALDRDGELREAIPVVDLKRATGQLLAALAARVEVELARVLALPWDQIDSLRLFDADLSRQARRLRGAARELTVSTDPHERAEGILAAHTLDAAVGLSLLIERRLATLVRMRGQEPLLPDERPFLDLAPALREAARAWV